MLIFLLFSDQISGGGGKVYERGNSMKRAKCPPPSVEESQEHVDATLTLFRPGFFTV